MEPDEVGYHVASLAHPKQAAASGLSGPGGPKERGQRPAHRGQWLKQDLIEYRRRHKNGRYIPVRTSGQGVIREGRICQEETILTVSLTCL